MSITDELRDCIRTANRSYEDVRNPYNDREILYIPEEELLAIAERIDEQHRKALEKLSALIDEDTDQYLEGYNEASDFFANEIEDLRHRVGIIERKLNHKVILT